MIRIERTANQTFFYAFTIMVRHVFGHWQFSLLAFSLLHFHCQVFIVRIFIVKFSLLELFIVKFSLLNLNIVMVLFIRWLLNLKGVGMIQGSIISTVLLLCLGKCFLGISFECAEFTHEILVYVHDCCVVIEVSTIVLCAKDSH